MIGRRIRSAAAATLALAGCFLLGATPAAGAPGDLDPSFSQDGKLSGCEDFTLREPGFSDVVVQGDGKIVTAGDCGIDRFDPDGTTDDSFVTPYTYPRSFAAVALQPDGKIVVAGHEYRYLKTTGSDFVVARYNLDGSRDDTFSGDGLVTMDFGGHDDEAKAIVVQPDDKIVVAGYSVELDADDVPSRDFALARYNPDGSLDSTFSDDGRRTTNFADDTAHDIALQADGRIVVGGTASGDFALARYNPDGTLDLGFSGNGRVTLGLADAQGSGARAIVVQPTGKIVAAGGGSGDFALARLGTNGSLDASFGGDGVVTTSFGESGGGAAAASDVLFRSGRLLAAGYANRGFALARYELDGHLDPGFSGDGMVTTDMGYEYARASSIAISPSGRIVVGGSGYSYILDYTASYGLLARYLSSNGPADADADGVLDSRDLCPQVFAPQHSDGCHRFRRSISLVLLKTDRKHRFFYGTLSGACVSDSRVRVFKIKRGGRRVKVAGATPYYNPDDARWSYSIPTNRTRGRYYAKLRRELTPGGWCSAARSPVLKLRRK